MYRILSFFLSVLLFLSPQWASAGFLVKKQTSPALVKEFPNQSAKSTPSVLLERVYTYRNILHGQADKQKDTPKNYKSMKTAWRGIASICCSAFGTVGFVLLGAAGIVTVLPILFILAGIVFGIMGMAKKNKYNGLAIAGLVVGLCGLFLCIVTAAIISMLK